MGRIIVTGGCGYIGSHTVTLLLDQGHEVLIIDDLSNARQDVVQAIGKITGIVPQFEQVDLSSSEKTKACFIKHQNYDAIIHFAASKAVGESKEKPLEYYKNNLNTLINTVQEGSANGIKNLIFSSSASVYGEVTKTPIEEDDLSHQPVSPYGNTKKIGEEILSDFTFIKKDFNAISLRYFNPIGAHPTALIGESPTGIPNNLLPYITQTASGALPELNVFGDDYPTKDGTAIRDYIHVMDLAEAHVKALNRLLEFKNTRRHEVFNIGSQKGYSVMEVIHAFEKCNKLKLNYKIKSRRAGDIAVLVASTSKAKNDLNWEASFSLEDMVTSAWNWEKSRK